MTRSPNGGIANGADLLADSTFFKVNTVMAHATGDFGSAASAAQNLIRLMEIVQQKANVKYIKVESAVVDLSDAAVRASYALGSDYNQAATTVYTIKFMIEQAKFLDATALEALIQGITAPFATAGVPITGPSTRSVTAYETVSTSARNVKVLDFDI